MLERLRESKVNMTCVRVLAFNAYLLPTGIFPRTYKDERLEDIVDLVSKYDVACLCEMWACWKDRPAQAIDKARERGFPFAARGPPRRALALSDGGLLTLSRVKIVDSESIVFDKYAGFVESFVSNGALYTQIIAGGLSVHIFNVHLNSDTSFFLKTVPGMHTHVRHAQLEQLRALMDARVGPGEAVLVCGDMNVDANNPLLRDEYNEMLSLLNVTDVVHHPLPRATLGDVRHVDGNRHPGEALFTSLSDQHTEQCIDYILFRPDSKGRVRVEAEGDGVLHTDIAGRPYTRLSDHSAVVVKLFVV